MIVTIGKVICLLINLVSPMLQIVAGNKYQNELRKKVISQIESKGYDYDKHFKNYPDQLFDEMRTQTEFNIENKHCINLFLSIIISLILIPLQAIAASEPVFIIFFNTILDPFLLYSMCKCLPYIYGDYTKGLGLNYHILTRRSMEQIDTICLELEKKGIITKSAETIRIEELKKIETEEKEAMKSLMIKYDKIDEPKIKNKEITKSIDYENILKQNEELKKMLEELKKTVEELKIQKIEEEKLKVKKMK